MTMEYRAWISIPGLPHDGDTWEPVIEALERDHDELGPVIAWSDTDIATIVMSTDTIDEATAAATMTAAVSEALHAAGLGRLYPTRIELALADDDRPQAKDFHDRLGAILDEDREILDRLAQ